METKIYKLEIKIWDVESGIYENTMLFPSIKGVEKAIAFHINEVGADYVFAQFWTLTSDDETDEFMEIGRKPDGIHVGARFIEEARKTAELANRHLQFLLSNARQ